MIIYLWKQPWTGVFLEQNKTIQETFLISAGNLFHKVGAAPQNAQSPAIVSD